MTRSRFCRTVAMLFAVLPLLAGVARGQAAGRPSLETLRQQRTELARRPRPIIMNNDGCDVLYFPKAEKATAEAFLAKRTTPLAGTQVAAIAFCPTSSGFSYFTHDTKIGAVLTRSGDEFGLAPDRRNIAGELIAAGADCLATVVGFCHAHGMEAFWSMRMNDTHDAAHRPDQPYFLFPPLKTEHPDWLVGEPVKRTPHGRWSSVDYARPAIRDLAFGFVEEVCRGYDVDGVELDFFRHLCYFKSTAQGGAASDAERAMMTGLVRRIRAMTEEEGMKRGRPILVAVRVPDSPGVCRDLGLDIERWMSEGLVDLLITTCYFQLNPWQYSVELGHKYGVEVYPCLSDSRVRGETRFRRGSAASYRGRAASAWAAGADGLHLFNFFDPKAEIWRQIGDPETLRPLDKLYFVTVRDGNPQSYLAGAPQYQALPLVCPSHPQLIQPSRPASLEIQIGDDMAAARRDGLKPQIGLHLEMPTAAGPGQLQVRLNGAGLMDGRSNAGWIDYPVPPDLLRRGANRVEIAATAEPVPEDHWGIVFEGGKKPQAGWVRDPGSPRTGEEVVDGALFLADRGESSGDYLYYRHAWGADPGGTAVVEARVKVKSGSSFLIVSNGESGERLGLWPDRIELFHNPKLRYPMDTTGDFHLYRMELSGPDLQVYVDGRLRIDAPGGLRPRAGYTRNQVSFGAANSPMIGEAYWGVVRARAAGLVLRDVAVSVSYEK
ncbi:MAG: hypothetical protein QM844_04465 [Planctomycetota bacterium]|nr:hypothetical protein [Planctomycetota bacterium]